MIAEITNINDKFSFSKSMTTCFKQITPFHYEDAFFFRFIKLHWSYKSRTCSKQCNKNSFQKIERGGMYPLILPSSISHFRETLCKFEKALSFTTVKYPSTRFVWFSPCLQWYCSWIKKGIIVEVPFQLQEFFL